MSVPSFLRPLVRPVVWIVRILAFVALFGLAMKNSGPVELHFYFGQVWLAPVSVMLLASFACGALIGLTAVAGWLIRRNKH